MATPHRVFLRVGQQRYPSIARSRDALRRGASQPEWLLACAAPDARCLLPDAPPKNDPHYFLFTQQHSTRLSYFSPLFLARSAAYGEAS